MEIKGLGERMGFRAQKKDCLDRGRDTILTKTCMKLKMADTAEVGLDNVCQELEKFFVLCNFFLFLVKGDGKYSE